MNAAALVVLDTNIVLDLFLFQDQRRPHLHQRLQSGQVQWWATAAMRAELAHVLGYPHLAAKLAFYQKSAAEVLAAFDASACLTEPPAAKAPFTCKDADDQIFIDLAASLAQAYPHHRVSLLSKDKAVLALRKRLERLTIFVSAGDLA